ncbi:PepSY-associated TM helix domain-containing protein [Paenibacillus gorillae]|uniref:PepSY-associated TM helix domain-containing protein n=1 Tax=Paenibacillus gorillae TaxID=1243662 RepID=UPI0004B46B62|nr:PepSY domain-containing protein [Paenibacillus gorillae]
MRKGSYNRLWRWHFYAALCITPLLITLTLSGIGYLFYTNIENKAYSDLFFGQNSQTERLTIDEGIGKARELNPDYTVSKVIVLDDPYNTRLTMTNGEGDQKYVFLDDNYQVVGSQRAELTFSNVMRQTHSSLFVGGTVVNYLVELAACWAVFLLLTGIYMTFRGKVLKFRQNPTKLQKNKKWHALIGTIVAIPMLVIIFTGLPWSAVMGDVIYNASQKYPTIGTPLLKQQPPASDRSEIPWATRKEEPPASSEHSGHHGSMPGMSTMPEDDGYRIEVEQLLGQIEESSISRPYAIIYPAGEDGVFTVSKSSNTGITGLDVSPYDEVTAYFDQYSGAFISKVGYDDYGILAKWFTWGIPLHEGHLFGWPNQLINLIICLAFLFVIFWGFKTWLSRRKAGRFSAPPAAASGLSIGFIIFMVLLGIMMPLFGLSLLGVLLIEGIRYLFIRKA